MRSTTCGDKLASGRGVDDLGGNPMKGLAVKSLSKHRPRPATIVAAIAVFLALGGTSYAVARGSIGSREIKNNDVRSIDVRNGTLSSGDLSRSAREALRGAQGPSGPRGPLGPQGPSGGQGPAGPAGPANVTVRSNSGTNSVGVFANCLEGERAVGGGAMAAEGTSTIWKSRPGPQSGTPTGWEAAAHPSGTLVFVYVLCAS